MRRYDASSDLRSRDECAHACRNAIADVRTRCRDDLGPIAGHGCHSSAYANRFESGASQPSRCTLFKDALFKDALFAEALSTMTARRQPRGFDSRIASSNPRSWSATNLARSRVFVRRSASALFARDADAAGLRFLHATQPYSIQASGAAARRVFDPSLQRLLRRVSAAMHESPPL
jgi:hypothetical protein